MPRPRAARTSLRISDADDVATAARYLAAGAFVVHAFANLYALTTRGDKQTTRAVNVFKGRPPGQVGSVTTTPDHLPGLLDLTRLTEELSRADVLGVLDELLSLGSFGFRAPAAAQLPDHLTVGNGTGRWVQVVIPGYRCPSNAFLALCLRLCGPTTCTSHRRTVPATRPVAAEESPHYRAAALRASLGDDPRLVVVEQDDEAAASAPPAARSDVHDGPRVPRRRARAGRHPRAARPADEVRSVVEHHGMALDVPDGFQRLGLRVY